MSKRVHFASKPKGKVQKSTSLGNTYINCHSGDIIRLKFGKTYICYTREELHELKESILDTGIIRLNIGEKYPKAFRLTQEHFKQINNFLNSTNMSDSSEDSGLSIHDSDFSFEDDDMHPKDFFENLIYEKNFDFNDITIFMDIYNIRNIPDIISFINHIHLKDRFGDDEITEAFRNYLRTKDENKLSEFSDLSINRDDVDDLANSFGML